MNKKMEEINLNYQMEMQDQKSIIKQYETKLLELEKEAYLQGNILFRNWEDKIKNEYFHNHGTTLNGLMKKHDIDAHHFLEFVHDVDLSFLDQNKDLEEEIKKLDGKKIIFTNGSRAHALNVTKRIGIDKLFDGIFDIRDCEFIPKPSKEPYKKLVENYKIEPQYCIFFEDIARNLKPAYELGMKTVWIKNDEPWAAKYSDSEFINYKTDNLAKFLKEINELR